MFCSPPCNRQEKEDTFTENYQYCTNGNNVRTIILDFGKVSVDDKVIKAIKICNGSCNEEFFEVHKDPITNPLDAVFHFHKYSWTAEPNSTIICQILYRPFLPFQRSVDYFTIVNCDREILKLIVRGESIGPNISISSDKLVMICRPGESVKKRVKITNNSDVPANFMFDVDEKQSSCKPTPTEGCINANSHVYVVITFTPKFEGPQALYLPCLIQHQAPIILQIYGYCGKKYTKEELNLPIIVYPKQKNSGFGSYMSDADRIRSGNEQLCEAVYPISLSNNYLDFGRVKADVHNLTLRHPQITCFTNHSQIDLVVNWDKDVDGIFEITPNNVRVKAKETCLFEIRFYPTEENTFYMRELVASVFCINSEDSEPDYHYAIIASIRIIGHTFSVDSSNWIPQYEIPQTVIMPACLPSRPAYATFLIKKFGHLPLMFRFMPPKETHFIIKPMLGVIHKKYQIVVVKMYPGELHNELLYERWMIRLNGNPNYEVTIDFRGYVEYPSLNFTDFVNFPPTHPGCEKIKSVSMRNTSRHNINYRYEDLPSVLNVDQMNGQIFANEILMHNWRFKPIEEGYYEIDFSCNFTAMRSEENEIIMENRLHITGKSECGYLVAIPNELNFGEQTYDERKKLDFELINPSSVEIPYTLMLRNNDWPYEGESIQNNVLIDPSTGILRPGESVKIEVFLTPQKSGFHECAIQYSIRLNSETEELSAMNNPTKIARIKFFCVLPTIKVEDLLHYGMVPCISKYVLWRLLNIKKLNTILNNLQPGEKNELEMHFPPMVIQKDAVVVKLLISNPTSTAATWSLKRIKSCSCAKATEKRSRKFNSKSFNCPHRNLCTMNPDSGTLKALENIVITAELRYEILGKNNLKWNLDIGHNRNVFLCMKIMALSENEQRATLLYGPRLELQKIYIGDKDPVNQICWIYNPTQNDIAYSFDTTAFTNVNEEHRSKLFSCENPSGVARAFSHEPVFIKFHPRRWGIYEIVVPLILGDEKTSITIKGECTNDPFVRICEEISPFRDAFHIPEVPVYFNADHITLPPIPMHSRVTRMTMVHNNLEHEVIAYKWKRFEIPGIIEINVEPQTGRIQPASLQTCRLIIVTGGVPCKLNADITCEFMNQSKIRDYEKEIFLHNSLREEMKDYFTITEKGTSAPKPKDLVLEAPKSFQKSLTVRCYIYSPQDERVKIPRYEKIKHTPEIEIPLEKSLRGIPATRETIALSTFILEGMIWDIVQNIDNTSPTATTKYSQIVMEPLQRRKIQERSYARPSGRMLERLLENMIFMIVHKEFALDVTHLPQTTDARQAAYQKMWQQVPKQKGLESSPKI